MMDGLRKILDGKEFSSQEEAQAEINKYMHRKNSAPLDEFHGLSSEQMYRFLHFPFDSPSLVRFADTIDPPQDAPVLKLFSLLAEAIGGEGLKPTAKGNLPQKFCREAALAYWGEEKHEKRTRYGSIRSEMDFFDMHCLRLVAGMAGLVRKYKGKFILSVKCRKKIAAHGVGAVYPDLFMADVRKFNWAYRYGYQEIPFVQQAFLFTLFLLSKYGNKSRPQTFYEDIFLQAFPAVFNEIEDVPYQSTEETARSAYFYRTLEDFTDFFGLAELQATSDDYRTRHYEIRKLPLLDQFISFTL
jgi:hypothetical protein